MHKIVLLSVGKPKTSWIVDGCAQYIGRLGRQCAFSERILQSGTLQEENNRIFAAFEKIEGSIVVLAESGKGFSSREFASWVGGQRDQGKPITFVIGGAYGLDERVMAKATLVLSLSRMTLPHELCKLVFLEQLYRAHSIMAGQQYHH